MDVPTKDTRALGDQERKRLSNIYTGTLPEGRYTLQLDYKAWGKSVSLWCYFTEVDSGMKVAINCFRSRKDNKTYGPQDDSIDFAVAGNQGMLFDAYITLGKKGYMNLKTATSL